MPAKAITNAGAADTISTGTNLGASVSNMESNTTSCPPPDQVDQETDDSNQEEVTKSHAGNDP